MEIQKFPQEINKFGFGSSYASSLSDIVINGQPKRMAAGHVEENFGSLSQQNW